MNIALIIAGGVGERMKQNIPKQFLCVFNKPIIVYTMEVFQRCNEIDSIIAVSLAGWEEKLREYAKQFEITKLESVIIGGACGQESIYNGIREIGTHYNDNDIVLVHDAIRPMVSNKIIVDCIDTVKKKGNAITVIPCQEAMLETKDQQVSSSAYPRNQLKRTQTPQGFYLKDMLAMHGEASEKGIKNSIATCTLAIELGKTVYFSNGSEKNLKITTLDDLYIFQALLKEETKDRVND